MTKINTVTFDLWQTLIIDSQELGRRRGRKRIEGTLDALSRDGCAVTQEQVQAGYRECWRACNKVRSGEGDVTFEEQIGIFLGSIDHGVESRITAETRSLIASRYADAFLEVPAEVDKDAGTVLRAVRDKGYRVGLICNTGATPGRIQRLFLGRLGLMEYFEVLTFSDEERLSKPAALIFARTLERLGSTSQESVHVGDHPVNDVVGAKRAGMKVVWLMRGDKEPEVTPDARIARLADAPDAIEGLKTGGP